MVFRAATHDQGSLAGRPAAGRSRRFYMAEDEGKLYYDDGIKWNEVGVEPIPPPALEIVGNVQGVEGATSVDMDAEGHVYVAAYFGDALVAVDVSDPTAPVEASRAATAGTNPRAVAVVGDRAYVVNSNDYLNAFDISNPAAISLLGSLNHTLNATYAVAARPGYAYFTLNSHHRVDVVDVSDPANMTVVGSTSVKIDYARAVEVLGDNHIVATGGMYPGLAVIDVSNPASPTTVGSVTSQVDFGHIDSQTIDRHVTVQGDIAYVTTDVEDVLTIVDCSDRANPVVLSSLSGIAELTDCMGVDVHGDYLYTPAGDTASSSAHGLSVFNVSDPTNPVVHGHLPSPDANSLTNAYDVVSNGHYSYVAARDSNSLTVVD